MRKKYIDIKIEIDNNFVLYRYENKVKKVSTKKFSNYNLQKHLNKMSIAIFNFLDVETSYNFVQFNRKHDKLIGFKAYYYTK